jgi:hypothetical protein
MPVTLNFLGGASAVVSAPAEVTVPAGSSSASWNVLVHSVSTATQVKMIATANGVSKTGLFTVSADRPSSLFFSPNPVAGGNNTLGTVGFPVPVSSDTVVNLSLIQGGTAVTSIPASVTVLSGTSSAQFTVGTNSVSTQVKISASANGGSKTATLTVQ